MVLNYSVCGTARGDEIDHLKQGIGVFTEYATFAFAERVFSTR